MSKMIKIGNTSVRASLIQMIDVSPERNNMAPPSGAWMIYVRGTGGDFLASDLLEGEEAARREMDRIMHQIEDDG